MNTEQILELIEGYQQIQKTNPQDSIAWLEASRELKFLFAEMAKSC